MQKQQKANPSAKAKRSLFNKPNKHAEANSSSAKLPNAKAKDSSELVIKKLTRDDLLKILLEQSRRIDELEKENARLESLNEGLIARLGQAESLENVVRRLERVADLHKSPVCGDAKNEAGSFLTGIPAMIQGGRKNARSNRS